MIPTGSLQVVWRPYGERRNWRRKVAAKGGREAKGPPRFDPTHHKSEKGPSEEGTGLPLRVGHGSDGGWLRAAGSSIP